MKPLPTSLWCWRLVPPARRQSQKLIKLPQDHEREDDRHLESYIVGEVAALLEQAAVAAVKALAHLAAVEEHGVFHEPTLDLHAAAEHRVVERHRLLVAQLDALEDDRALAGDLGAGVQDQAARDDLLQSDLRTDDHRVGPGNPRARLQQRPYRSVDGRPDGDVRAGPDRLTPGDVTVDDDRAVEHRDLVLERRVPDPAAGEDRAALTEAHAAFQARARVEHGVLAHLHVDVDVGGGGVDHGHALGHQPVEDAPALDGRQLGELATIVDAERLGRIAHRHGLDPGAGLRHQADDVGEVQLALVVVGLDLAERRPQPARVEAVHAGVDLVDPLLVVGGVALLDDAIHAPAQPEHAPVAVRTLDLRGEHGRRRSARALVLHEPLKRFQQ